MGTAEAMTASWMAVENAATYEVTWKGQTTVYDATTTSFVVAADEVAALGIGEYTLSVVAKPVETSSKWIASEAGTTSFEIIAPPTGGIVTWQWNFSSIFADKAVLVNTTDTGDFMLNSDGSVTAAANTNLGQTLYLSGNGKKIEVKMFSNTADNCNYLAMTYGGGAAYSYINVDKPGRLTIVASQGKTAADNATCELAIYKNTPKENQVGENMVLPPYDTAAPKNGAQTFEFELTDITEPTKLIIYKPTGSTSPLIYDIQYTYEEVVAKEEYVWDFSTIYTENVDLVNGQSTDFMVNADGSVTEASNTSLTGTLYLSPQTKKISIRSYANTADNVTYYTMTYSSGNAYAYINIDKPGKLVVTATQGKTAADNATCQLQIYTGAGPKDGGTAYSERIDLQPYDTAAPKNGAQSYEFEFNEVTELTKVAITKPGGSTSPDFYKIEWYAN